MEPTRVGGAAPSLTLAHLDLNNPGDGPSDIGAFLKRQDSTSSQNTEDDDNPWGLSQAPYGGKSNDFEYPKDAEVWRAQHKRKGSELPKFAFDDQSSSSDEEREADHDKWDEDSDDDDKPLNTLSRKPQERSVSQASKGHHEKTKSDVGTLLGIQSDLFGSKPVSRRSSSSSSGDDDSNEDLKELAATSEAPKRIRKPSSLGFGQVLSADADESSSDDDDRPLGQLPSSHSAKSAHSSSRQPSHNAPDDVPIGRLNPLLANHFAEEVPLGAQQPEFANAQNQENTALGQRFPGFAYKRSVQQQQEAAQAEALRLAEQQQNFHYAQMQQELMFQQAMLQQQQEQQQMQWAYMQALQNQTGVDGSMLGFSGPIAPEVASRNQKLVSRVDNWRADVE